MIIRRRKGKDKFYNKAYNKHGNGFHDRTNEIYNTNDGECIITEYNRKDDIIVRFTTTGYVTKTNIRNLHNGKVKDYRKISVCSVGRLGDEFKQIKSDNPKLYRKVYNCWLNMINRCFNISHSSYKYYGAKGVTVHICWWNFSTFFYDFIKLPGYNETRYINGELSLDKDKNSTDSKLYSCDTCELLTNKEQNAYITGIHANKDFICIHPNGDITNERNIDDFCRLHDLIPQDVSACILGQRKSHKLYRFKSTEKCNDYRKL